MKRLPTEQPILSILSVGYLVTFVALGFASDLGQTIFYAVFMVVAFALVAVTYTHFRLRPLTLWGLSLWGVAHMAGGLLSVGGVVLYHFDLILSMLRFDQVVHAFGFGFAAAACWDVLGEVITQDRPAARSVLALLGGLGFGAINEAIEFLVTRIDPSSNVGGFVTRASTYSSTRSAVHWPAVHWPPLRSTSPTILAVLYVESNGRKLGGWTILWSACAPFA